MADTLENNELGAADIERLLNEPDEGEGEELDLPDDESEEQEEEPGKEKIGKPEEKPEEEEEDKDKKKEIKLKDEEESEETEELVVPVSKKKILAKYPNLFKDFPYLEKAYYADQAYKELLPTIDDAKEVIGKAQVLDNLEQKIMQGSTEDVLKGIKDSDPNVFAKIVDNYLPNLAKVDQGAFNHVLGSVIKNTIVSMVNEAQHSNNEDLRKAALILNQFAFGTSQFTPHQRLSREENNDQNRQLQDERARFVKERFDVTRDDLNTRIQNVLKSTINEHMDPKNAMSDYVKRNAVREALEMTDNLIANDREFRSMLDKMWQRAFERNFDRDSIQKIRSAYLAKAKTILPNAIARVRNEALKGARNSGKETPQKRVFTGNREQNPNRPAQSNKDNKGIPRNMKTLDFLMQD